MAKQFQFFGLGLFYWGRLYGLISNFQMSASIESKAVFLVLAYGFFFAW